MTLASLLDEIRMNCYRAVCRTTIATLFACGALLAASCQQSAETPAAATPAAATPAPTVAPPAGVLLADFPAAPNAFRLVIGECKDTCPVRVERLVSGQVRDSYTLPVEVTTQQFTVEKVDENWGAEPGIDAWATGEEGNYVSTAARV